jgi:hypothetical protein
MPEHLADMRRKVAEEAPREQHNLQEDRCRINPRTPYYEKFFLPLLFLFRETRGSVYGRHGGAVESKS